MGTYVKKYIPIQASQWFTNGDHPDDGRSREFPQMYEGEVVRYYSPPEMRINDLCKQCDTLMKLHGWIDTLEGGHIVCPTDWIITGVQGEHYPCKHTIFMDTYVTEEDYAKSA